MHHERGFFGIAYDNKQDYIYVLGGENGIKKINTCEKYSIQNDKWTFIKPMSQKKSKISACIFNNQFIYSIGGLTEGQNYIQIYNEIEKYDIGENTWSLIQIDNR